MLNTFLKKVDNKEAIITVVGLGYVGLPLMLRFAQVGYRVIGIDTDNQKNKLINQGESYIKHIDSAAIKAVSHLIKASDDFSQITEADAIILCVPTPLNAYREPDLSYVVNTTEMVEPYLRPGQLLSLESTTYPGTTEEELLPRVERNGLTVGEDFFLVYSPEREDPGNPHFTTSTIPKICGGHTESCRQAGVAMYSAVINEVVPMSSTKSAEMTKLLENIHRSVNIGLVNEMKILADKMNIDIFEVIDAAATKPFGFVAYYPGPGIGGHCIPIDPFYLTWKAREYGMHTRFIELSGEINNGMPKWVVHKVADALNLVEKSIKNSRILILGVAYKCDIDDMRESPSLDLIKLLREKEAIVSYCDPYVPELSSARGHSDFDMKSVTINPEIIQTYDCVLLATSHRIFDYEMIAKHAKLIVDTRGKFRKFKQTNIVSA